VNTHHTTAVGLLLGSLLLGTPCLMAQQPADTLPHPAAWSTYFMVFLHDGPQTRDRSPAASRALQGHIQYQLRLQADGHAIAAGGLGPATGTDLAGLVVLRVARLEDAVRLAENDPAVRFGRFRAVVRPWYVPSGLLPPPGG
jgi:uncharacterized protein YciI